MSRSTERNAQKNCPSCKIDCRKQNLSPSNCAFHKSFRARAVEAMAFVTTLFPRRKQSRLSKCFRRRNLPALYASAEQRNPAKVWVCTSSTCRGKSLLSTMRALTSDVQAFVEPTGCLGECGNGPNVAVETSDRVHVSIEKHIDSVNEAVRLLRRLKVDVNEEVLRVAVEKEKGDNLMLKGTEGEAGEHYEKAIGILECAEFSCNKWTEEYKIAILCNWAQSAVKISAYEKALLLVNKIIDVHPDYAAAWKWKAQAHDGMRQLDMAKQCWGMWGSLSGKTDEAQKQINRLTGWRGWLL